MHQRHRGARRGAGGRRFPSRAWSAGRRTPRCRRKPTAGCTPFQKRLGTCVCWRVGRVAGPTSPPPLWACRSWDACLQLLNTPDTTVQFYAANLLCTKARSSWLSLDDATRASLYERLLAAVGAVLDGRLVVEPPVQNRLCGAVSTAAALGGVAMCESYLTQAVSLGGPAAPAAGSRQLDLAVELLQAFAQETLLRPNAHAELLLPVTRRHVPSIVQVLDRHIAAKGPTPAVFKCAKVSVSVSVSVFVSVVPQCCVTGLHPCRPPPLLLLRLLGHPPNRRLRCPRVRTGRTPQGCG